MEVDRTASRYMNDLLHTLAERLWATSMGIHVERIRALQRLTTLTVGSNRVCTSEYRFENCTRLWSIEIDSSSEILPSRAYEATIVKSDMTEATKSSPRLQLPDVP